jgi:hypothetical protein
VALAISESAKEPTVQKVLHFLSRSQIPDEFSNVSALKIKGKDITIGDLATLNPGEVQLLFNTEAEQLLEESARRSLYGVFCLYVRKVGLTDEELNNGYGPNKKKPLHIAAIQDDIGLVKKLLKHPKIDPSVLEGERGWARRTHDSPLHCAADKGHLDVVKELLKHPDIDPNIQDEYGRSPLHWAASRGHLDVVKELLKHHDIDPNIQDEYGQTALSFAVKNNHYQVVELLLAHGAQPSLSMLLNNTFSRETNAKLRSSYLSTVIKPGMSYGWSVLEGASKAFSGDITEFYEEDYKSAVKKQEASTKAEREANKPASADTASIGG